MKTAKSITNGLALLLAVFILLFLATEYIGYHPSDDALKETSKAELFFEQNEMRRDYFRLMFLLCLSAAVGLLFDRLPEFGVFSALLPLSYALLLLPLKRLTKHPMVIVSLCLAHLCGAVVTCGYKDRSGKGHHASNASILSSLAALGCTGYSLFYLGKLRAVSAELEALDEAGVTVPTKVTFSPDLVRMAAMKLENYGESEAREMLSSFSREINFTALKTKILDTVKEDQFTFYFRLAILLFGAAVLMFALRRKLRLIPAVLSVVPFVYAAFMIHLDHMDTVALPILTTTLFAMICGITAYDQYGKGHDPAYDEEPAPEPPSDDPEETYYT